MDYVVGVDFGAARTSVVARSGGVSRTVTLANRGGPVSSAAFVRDDGSYLFGEDAVALGSQRPDRYVPAVRRLLEPAALQIELGDVRLRSEDVVSAFLSWVVTTTAHREGGSPSSWVMAVPAAWTPARRSQLHGIATDLGLPSQLTLGTEAEAAAQYGHHPVAPIGSLLGVFDLGGTSFDATVLRVTDDGFEVVSAERFDHLGGEIVDDAVMALVRGHMGSRWHAAHRSSPGQFDAAAAGVLRECIAAKEDLSVNTLTEVPVLLPGLATTASISRTELESLVEPSLTDTVAVMQRVIARAATHAENLAGILVIGGTSQMPMVRRLLDAAFGSRCELWYEQSTLVVARGAALLADRYAGQERLSPER